MKYLVALGLTAAFMLPAVAQQTPKPPVHTRKPYAVEAPFGAKRNDAGKGFFQLGDTEISRDNQVLARAEDTVGGRQYVQTTMLDASIPLRRAQRQVRPLPALP